MYPQPNTGSNGLAIASLVLGIVSLVLVAAFSWMLWGSIAGLCLGIVGTILGVMGRKNATGRTMATAGMILTATTGINRFIPCFEQTESFSLFCFFSEVTTCIPALHYSILPYHLIGLWL